jgi:hypothetical protein
MSPILSQVLIAFFTALLGFVAGAFVMYLWSEREKERPESSDFPEGINLDEHQSVVRLWRDVKTGALLTEYAGKVYRKGEKPEKNPAKNLRQVGMEWAGWLAGLNTQAPVETKPAASSTVVAPTPVPASSSSQSKQGDSNSQLPPALKPTPSVTVLPGAITPTVVQNEVPVAKSMVQAIDEILQERLENSPLKSKGIKLVEQPPVGVVVWVGLEHYNGVEDVPDEEVKALIRSAVSIWEEKNSRT